jgi:hypothetical protein
MDSGIRHYQRAEVDAGKQQQRPLEPLQGYHCWLILLILLLIIIILIILIILIVLIIIIKLTFFYWESGRPFLYY